MALVKLTLESNIKNVLSSIRDMARDSQGEATWDELDDMLAEGLADVIDAYIRSGTVSTSVVGTSQSGGSVTATGTGTVS